MAISFGKSFHIGAGVSNTKTMAVLMGGKGLGRRSRGFVGKENQFRELQIKTGMVVGRDD